MNKSTFFSVTKFVSGAFTLLRRGWVCDVHAPDEGGRVTCTLLMRAGVRDVHAPDEGGRVTCTLLMRAGVCDVHAPDEGWFM